MPENQRPSPSPGSGFEDLGLVRRPGLRGWFRKHPGCMNAVVIAIYLLMALWTFPIALVDMEADALWLLAAYALTAMLLCFRRTRPLTVLLGIAALEAVQLLIYPWNGSQMVALWFAAYCVARDRGLVRGLMLSVPLCAVAYTVLLRYGAWERAYGPSWWMEEFYPAFGVDFPQALITLALSGLMFTPVAVGIGAAVRANRRHEQEILEWAQRTHGLAQAAERNRIAREMHDVVAHSLSVMISLADGAKVVGRRDFARAEEVLSELSLTGRTALDDMRRVIGVLTKGEELSESRRPVHESLEELYEGFRQAGLPLRVRTSGPPLPEDAAFGLTVHRIIQESLTNVLRYGRQVTDVEVSVEHTPGTREAEWQQLAEEGYSRKEAEALGLGGPAQVVLSITDDGAVAPAGHHASVGSGMGIRGMQERAGFYSGSVWAGPGKYRGWEVRAVLEPPQRRSEA